MEIFLTFLINAYKTAVQYLWQKPTVDHPNGRLINLPFTLANAAGETRTGYMVYDKSGNLVELDENTPPWSYAEDGSGCPSLLLYPEVEQLISDPEALDTSFTKHTLGTGVTPTVTDSYGTFKGRPTTRIQCSVGALDDNSRSYIQQAHTSADVSQVLYARSLSGTVTATVLSNAGNNTQITTAWQKFELTGTFNALRIGIIDIVGNDPSQSIDIEVALVNSQVAYGQPTIFIPAALTRNAPKATTTTAVTDGLISAQSWTARVVYRGIQFGSQNVDFSVKKANEDLVGIYYKGNGTWRIISRNGATTETNDVKTGYTDGDPIAIAISVDNGDIKIAVDGAEVVTTLTTDTGEDFDRIEFINQDGTTAPNSVWLDEFGIVPTATPIAILEQITA